MHSSPRTSLPKSNQENEIKRRRAMPKNIATLIFILALIALAATLFMRSGPAGGFIITSGGQPKARIVTGENPPETVAFAAKELQNFVKKMSGAELPIATKSEPESHSIRLGHAALEKIPESEFQEVRRDGYIITVKEGDLCIAGIDDRGQQTDIEELLKKGVIQDLTAWNFNRGTLNGVYRLLEELGMRWFMPGDFGERAPAKKTLSFAGDIRENPRFITRTVGSWRLHKAYYNSIRNITIMPGERAEIGFEPAENRLWEIRMRGETFRIPLNHNPPRARWVERFATNHPEYFALLSSGKRASSGGQHVGHLCYTHPGVLKENVEDIKAFAAGKTAVERGIPSNARNSTNLVFPYNRNWCYDIALDGYFSIMPNDGFQACTCPECKKLTLPDSVPQKQKYSKLVWSFVSKCAEAVPDTKITCLAYGSYAIPYPDMPKLPPNVVVGFCAYSHPASLYYKDSFERYEKLVGEWAALTQGPMAFWQHYLGSNRSEENVGMPEHTPEMYAKVIRTMAKYGNHAFCEQVSDSIMFELFNRYLLLKLFYNPDLDEKEIFRDYVTRFYGPAAGPIIGEIYDDIGKKCVEKYSHGYAAYSFWEKLFDDKTMRSYREKTDLALKKTAGTEFEKAVLAFKKYYLGLMERGRMRYADPLAFLLEDFNPLLSCALTRKPVKIDGQLDEPVWKSASAVDMRNTVNGKMPLDQAQVRTCHDSQHVYFAVTASDPGIRGRHISSADPGQADGIEILLDVSNGRQNFCRIGIDLAGKIYASSSSGSESEVARDCGAAAAVIIGETNYVVEVSIPRASLNAPGGSLAPYEWGVLVARNQIAAASTNDRTSSTSPLLRGSLFQPHYFNSMKFTER